MPHVSVITPARNAAEFIADTLRSASAQTFPDWELLLVDDASFDDTVRVARELDEPRLRVVRSDERLGPAGARNLALDHATGELVALLDADDRWLPSYLERQVALFDTEEARLRGVGIVACDAWMETPDGRRPGTYGERFGFPDRADLTRLLRSNPIFVSALCPRAVVEEVGRFSTECFGSEDHDLWLRILEAGYRIVSTREPLAVYRLSAGSVSADPLGMARTTEATYRRALDRGRLDRRQRRIARRRLRVARSAAALEALLAPPVPGDAQRWRRAVLAAPLMLGTALGQPASWPRWARLVATRVRRAS